MKISLASLYSWYRGVIRNPKYRWWIISGTLLYLLSPIDISPDIIPIAGQIDDFAVLTILVTEVSAMILDSAKEKKEESNS